MTEGLQTEWLIVARVVQWRFVDCSDVAHGMHRLFMDCRI